MLINKNSKKPADNSNTPAQPVQHIHADEATIERVMNIPEVRRAIERDWDAVKTSDLEMAYTINQTDNWGMADDNPGNIDSDRQRLYSNPIVQEYVNNIGQRLVPSDSTNLYSFRVLYDPIPKTVTLSTGSIYVSTGLLSMVDNGSQLAYILGHEIAHVEKQQVYLRIRDQYVDGQLAKEKAQKQRLVNDVATTALGALGGDLIGGTRFATAIGGFMGGTIGLTASHYFIHPRIEPTVWDTHEEDDADQLSAQYMLSAGYDPRQIPALYNTIGEFASKDSRVSLGIIGSAEHVEERISDIQNLLDGDIHDAIAARVKGQGFLPESPDFSVVFSSIRRDNGALAMQYDLFAVAKQNLEDAVKQRPEDPAAHFYLAKLERRTAHTPPEKQAAIDHLTTALRLDAERGSIPELHWEYAVALMEQGNPANKDLILSELKSYLVLYERDWGGLPRNLSVVYDYFNQAGDNSWYLSPEWYKTTQLVYLSGHSTSSAAAVIRNALSPSPAPATETASAPTAAHSKLASAHKKATSE
jgi:predicted Zn-dependent protease